MPFGASEEQALAVFISSGEAARFLIDQRWQVTNYALAAYVALVAAPEWISRNCHRTQVTGGLLCAFLAFVICGLTSYHLCNLHEQHADQLDSVYAAGKKLPLVAKLYGWPPPTPGPGRVICALVAALFVGALLVAWINLSRPAVAAWFNARWLGPLFAGALFVARIALSRPAVAAWLSIPRMLALFAGALLVAWISFCFFQHPVQAERARQGETWGPELPLAEEWLT